MKKFFMFAAMASVAFASCVKNEPAMNLEQGDLITFDAPVVAPATKAAGTVEYPGDGKFVLFGWYHTAAWNTVADNTADYKYIPEVVVSKHGAETYFRPDAFYYWPKSGNLSFFAYSPSALPDGSGGALAAADMTTTSSVSVTYTVPALAAHQVDFLYSDWALNKSKADYVTLSGDLGAYNGVEIVFNHALSSVIFKMKTTEKANGLYKIHSVSLSGLMKMNTLTSTPAGTSWGTASSDATYAITPYAENILHKDSDVTSDNFILLPQSLANAKLTINYSLLNPGDNSTWILQDAKVINLNTAVNSADHSTIATWELGKKYTYNLVFDVDIIQLAPSIKADWIGVDATLNTDPAN